jgi:hypothetical protein
MTSSVEILGDARASRSASQIRRWLSEEEHVIALLIEGQVHGQSPINTPGVHDNRRPRTGAARRYINVVTIAGRVEEDDGIVDR